MTVRMLRTERIAVDGIRVRWYMVGEILNLPDPLGEALIRDLIATDSLQPIEEDSISLSVEHQPKPAAVRPTKKREYQRNKLL